MNECIRDRNEGQDDECPHADSHPCDDCPFIIVRKHERDGELECHDCDAPLLFLGTKVVAKHGYSDSWKCPDCEEIIRFDENGELIE